MSNSLGRVKTTTMLGALTDGPGQHGLRDRTRDVRGRTGWFLEEPE